MIGNFLICAAAAVFISGCTTFSHPTKTQDDFNRDRKECEQYAAANPGDNATCARETVTCATCEDVKRCLQEKKGWTRVRN